MCTSSATLFFGVCVKVLPLVVAAGAWPKIEPVFLAIDLIRTRRRRGDLRVDAPPGRATVADVPEEIWETVRLEVSSEGFVAEATDTVRSYHYGYDDDSDDEWWDHKAQRPRPVDVWNIERCDCCIHNFYEDGAAEELFQRSAKVLSFSSSHLARLTLLLLPGH
jgi:hypothetical protein